MDWGRDTLPTLVYDLRALTSILYYTQLILLGVQDAARFTAKAAAAARACGRGVRGPPTNHPTHINDGLCAVRALYHVPIAVFSVGTTDLIEE